MYNNSENLENVVNESQIVFNIQHIYLKDMSLEQPNSPTIFLKQKSPSTTIVDIKVSNEKLYNSIYEVVVTVTVTTQIKNEIALLIEMSQAGVFDIQYISNEKLDPLINIACPAIIFPYLRSNIADLISRSGFQPFHLAEINFQALYEEQCKIIENQKVFKT